MHLKPGQQVPKNIYAGSIVKFIFASFLVEFTLSGSVVTFSFYIKHSEKCDSLFMSGHPLR